MKNAPFPMTGSLLLAFAAFATSTSALAAADKSRCATAVLAAAVNAPLTVKSADLVAEGPKAPEHCRVLASLPTVGNEVEFVVGLPTDWNGKFMWNAQGGFAGLPMDLITQASRHYETDVSMKAGYAVGVTDTGHKGRKDFPGGPARDTTFIADVNKLIDYAHRANYVAADGAKTLIRAYYGSAAKRAIFSACSNGGRAAMINAQRYPGQFDGYIVGAPFISPTRTSLDWLLRAKDGFFSSERAFPTADKLKLVGDAVRAACDAKDGVEDGVVANPLACKFDPRVLQCKGDDGADCLTREQADAFALWNSDIGRSAGDFVTHRWPFTGAEGEPTGTTAYQVGPKPAPLDADGKPLIVSTQNAGFSVINAVLGDMVYLNPSYDVRKFDIETDLGITAQIEGMMAASDTDLSPAIAKGAKFLFWHGWADPALNPLNTIDYVEAARKRLGSGKADAIRLFLAPGMTHCGGGAGATDVWSSSAEMEKWLDTGTAPEQIEAVKRVEGRVVRKRPLCAYPRFAAYKGSGDVEDSASFECRLP
jgi:Tannase and feruloyl esterase